MPKTATREAIGGNRYFPAAFRNELTEKRGAVKSYQFQKWAIELQLLSHRFVRTSMRFRGQTRASPTRALLSPSLPQQWGSRGIPGVQGNQTDHATVMDR